MPDGREWPTISIVTPNYNYAEFLEQTIRSVLLQSYPRLEYIVVDGGSTDGSVDILRKYERWLRWESRPDTGQAAAINRGLQMATGDIRAFLNSDDFYQPGALAQVARTIEPAQRLFAVMGDVMQVDARGVPIRRWTARAPTHRSLLCQHRLCRIGGIVVMPSQPAVFWHREVQDAIGSLREDLKYGFDYEYWLRMLTNEFAFHYVPEIWAGYRFHSRSLSSRGWQAFYPEWESVSDEYRVRLTPAIRRSVELYWWGVLLPLSIVTLPHRLVSYLLGIKRG
jgi:glycosyltransferase involved in cell wall biosynthesis